MYVAHHSMYAVLYCDKIGHQNVEPIAAVYKAIANIQVFYYSNSMFRTKNSLCMLLKGYAIVPIVPTTGRPVLC